MKYEIDRLPASLLRTVTEDYDGKQWISRDELIGCIIFYITGNPNLWPYIQEELGKLDEQEAA